MENYTLSNGWVVRYDGTAYYMDVKPIENTFFRKAHTVDIPCEFFEVVRQGVNDVQILAKEYNLYKYAIKWSKPKKTPKKENTATKYYGRGWIVEKTDDKYFLDYLLGGHGGGSERIEITEEIYLDARTGEYSLTDLFKKYNLY